MRPAAAQEPDQIENVKAALTELGFSAPDMTVGEAWESARGNWDSDNWEPGGVLDRIVGGIHADEEGDSQTPQFTFNTAGIAGGDQIYLRVLASDGLNTARAQVGPSSASE